MLGCLTCNPDLQAQVLASGLQPLIGVAAPLAVLAVLATALSRRA